MSMVTFMLMLLLRNIVKSRTSDQPIPSIPTTMPKNNPQDTAQQKVKMLQEELDTAKSDAARTSQKLQSFQQAFNARGK